MFHFMLQRGQTSDHREYRFRFYNVDVALSLLILTYLNKVLHGSTVPLDYIMNNIPVQKFKAAVDVSVHSTGCVCRYSSQSHSRMEVVGINWDNGIDDATLSPFTHVALSTLCT